MVFNHSILPMCLLLISCKTVCSSNTPQIKLWTGSSCNGNEYTTSNDVPNLNSNNKYYSAQVKGSWILYEGANYGYGMVDAVYSSKFACKKLQNISVVNGHVGSLQYVGDRQDFQSRTLTIFQRELFGGTGTLFRTGNDYTKVDYTGSLVVTGVIPWQVFEDVEQTGNSVCVIPSPVSGETAHPKFIHATRGSGIPFNIRSVQCGCDETSWSSYGQ